LSGYVLAASCLSRDKSLEIGESFPPASANPNI
jgi:hypothetical protein